MPWYARKNLLCNCGLTATISCVCIYLQFFVYYFQLNGKNAPLENLLQSISFHFLHFFSDSFTDQSSLPRTLCVYKRRDFSPPTRDSFFGESKHQTRTGNPGGQRNERSVSYLLVYVSIQMYQ